MNHVLSRPFYVAKSEKCWQKLLLNTWNSRYSFYFYWAVDTAALSSWAAAAIAAAAAADAKLWPARRGAKLLRSIDLSRASGVMCWRAATISRVGGSYNQDSELIYLQYIQLTPTTYLIRTKWTVCQLPGFLHQGEIRAPAEANLGNAYRLLWPCWPFAIECNFVLARMLGCIPRII